jgi:cytoskeletal protein RodZ
MTTTALMPVDPSVSPQQAARVLSIRADLLPPEIRDGRRSRRIRSLIAFVLLLVVGAVGAWYWQATVAKQSADEEYEQMFQKLAQTRTAQKTEELRALVEYQEGGASLNKELTTVLAQDLSWTNLINLLRDEATAESVELTEISGSLAGGDSGTATDSTAIGTVTITGTAENKKVVADYVNKLGTLEHVTNPFVTNVNRQDGEYTFSLMVTITDEALCGRFTKDCPSGGK